MSENENDTATRVCEWCAESIPQQALRCPHCQKWRKDIDKDRSRAFFWGLANFLPALLFLKGFSERWWHEWLWFLPVEFSIKKFLTSPYGLAILAGFIITFSSFLHYYAKVSRKIGSWWW